jgi:hypothetical protein
MPMLASTMLTTRVYGHVTVWRALIALAHRHR